MKKAETAQLVLKFPDASESTISRLRKLLTHYTGKLVTKTECIDAEEDSDDLDLNAEPETVTTAELTLKLTDASLGYIVENILEQKSFDTLLSKNGIETFEETKTKYRANKKLEKGA